MKVRTRSTVKVLVWCLALTGVLGTLAGCTGQDEVEKSVAAAVDSGGRPMQVEHDGAVVTVTIEIGEKPLELDELNSISEQLNKVLEGTGVTGKLATTDHGKYGVN